MKPTLRVLCDWLVWCAVCAALAVSCLDLARGQDTQAPDIAAPLQKHMESVTWDCVEHKLLVVVSTGRTEKGKYVPETIKEYEVSLERATVSTGGKSFEFSHYESELVWRFMDWVEAYAKDNVDFFQMMEKKQQSTEAPKESSQK